MDHLKEQTSTKPFRLSKHHQEARNQDVSISSSDGNRFQEILENFKIKEANIKCRGIFILSKLVQKVLRHNEKTLSLFGSGFEMCLNIMGNKSNFGLFVKNLLRGKIVVPSKQSASFISTVGHVDNRVDLDQNIKPGNRKYLAFLSAMASKLAYENNEFIRVTIEERWKMELLGVYNIWDERYEGNTTQACMFRDKSTNSDTIFVSFRGTEIFNAADWSTDFDLSLHKFHDIKGGVHGGFMKALGLKSDGTWPKNTDENLGAYNTILGKLKCHFETNRKTRFVLTGHSLGGALAVLFPAVLAMHGEIMVLERLDSIYTFGQPKVGDEKFGKFMKEMFEHYGIGYYRFVYSHDIVPRLPYDDLVPTFKHFGTCLDINSLYEAKVVEEEQVKNYFDLGSMFTERVDALWELVRSFLLPRMFGPDYKEGLLLKMFRIVGLVFPGLPAHGPQDYINATRLATY